MMLIRYLIQWLIGIVITVPIIVLLEVKDLTIAGILGLLVGLVINLTGSVIRRKE